MKVNDLFEAWVIKNKDGKEKRFKNDDSPEALAWKNSTTHLEKHALEQLLLETSMTGLARKNQSTLITSGMLLANTLV